MMHMLTTRNRARLTIFTGLALFVLCGTSLHLFAQEPTVTIRIRALNGHTGKPIAHVGIFPVILPAMPRNPVIGPAPRSDDSGSITMIVPADRNINATVGYYPTCRHVPEADRHHGLIVFPISQIVSTGFVETNNCCKRTVPPIPGELTLFVRPLHWWERLSE